MAQRSPESRLNRIALGLVAATAAFGTACAALGGPRGEPPAPSAPVDTRPAFPLPDRPPPEAARLVTDDAVDAGKAPVGALVVAYQRGPVALFIWQTADRGLCGEYAGVQYRVLAGCVPGEGLRSAGRPVVRPVLGPAAVTGTDWLAVLVADGEQLRGLGCAGVLIAAHQVARLTAPGGEPLTAYTYDAPWLPAGVLQAQVQRADGPAVEPVPINPARADRHAKYSRTCDSFPPAPAPAPAAPAARP